MCIRHWPVADSNDESRLCLLGSESTVLLYFITGQYSRMLQKSGFLFRFITIFFCVLCQSMTPAAAALYSSEVGEDDPRSEGLGVAASSTEGLSVG